MEKIKNLSLRKTILLYMVIHLTVCFFLSAYIIQTATDIQSQIWLKYTDEAVYTQDHPVERISNIQMSSADVHISELCDFLETWSVLLVSICGSIMAVFLFYKNKLKVPLIELKNGSRMIAENNLDFSITYSNQDELGELCKEFERMRRQLEANNKITWKTIEQGKALRSAISHDIRSPLAILSGYQEILLEYIPQENLDKEKALDMVRASMNQIEFLNSFIETMPRLSGLEDRKVKYQEMELTQFAALIKSNSNVLERSCGKTLIVKTELENRRVWFDPHMVTEVLDNLLANAVRYAKKEVVIDITTSGDKLVISVLDDGTGFKDGEDQVTKAYYHANPQDDLNHFGLGLYISRVYCEKHGGRLLIGNQELGGAQVIAVFQIKR